MTIQVRSNEPVVTEQKDAPESKEHPSALEAKSSEQNESSESETEETEAKEASESEDGSESHDDSDESKDSDEDKPKKKGGFQRRIDKLNAKHAAAQQEAEYWKQQALKGNANDQNKPNVDKPKSSQEGKPNPEHIESHADFIEAVADWKADQKLKERDDAAARARLENENKQIVKSYHDRVKTFAEKKSDFAEVLESVDDIPASVTVQHIILNSDNGPELAYELAKNPDELRRISELPPIEAARAIGRLESKLASNSSEEKTEIKKLTKAPKPLEPVGKSTKGVAAKSLDDPSLSQAEYERLRREQMKRRAAQV